MKIKILLILDYFLPGHKGGGPVRTLENMRLGLAQRVDIATLTRDHDLGCSNRYEGIEVNRWHETPQGPIFYADAKNFGWRALRTILSDQEFDIIYLNSFFSLSGSIIPRVALAFFGSRKPLLLAPRGEFSSGALSVKKMKKQIYLRLAKILKIYDKVFWHASTELEAADILRQFPGAADKTYIASDPVAALDIADDTAPSTDTIANLRMVFISRISPMKNLDGLLRILTVMEIPIGLDVFGPIEDTNYWHDCLKLIDVLPANIRVKYSGELSAGAVPCTFASYDLFALPTLGENFGHVIFEALLAGTPVLISDRTPWPPDEKGAVRVIPLDDPDAWGVALRSSAAHSIEEKMDLRYAARAYANNYLKNHNGVHQTYDMFRSIVAKSSSH